MGSIIHIVNHAHQIVLAALLMDALNAMLQPFYIMEGVLTHVRLEPLNKSSMEFLNVDLVPLIVNHVPLVHLLMDALHANRNSLCN